MEGAISEPRLGDFERAATAPALPNPRTDKEFSVEMIAAEIAFTTGIVTEFPNCR